MELPGVAPPVEPYGHGRGYVDFLNPSNPAAGSGLVQKLDTTWLWRPLSIRFALATDANAANRFPTVDYTDPDGNVWVRNAAGLVLTANTPAQTFDFNAQRTVAEWAANTDVLAPLSDFFIPGGWQIRINVANVQAGDQISAIRLYVEKWVTGKGTDLGGAAWAAAALRRGH